MSTARCQGCGAALDTSSGNALCPACMLRDVLSTKDGDEIGATSPAGPALPRAFGNFELQEEIGRGGMGVVYAARQAGLDRTVAVKLLLSGVHASETALQRFHAEAAAAAGLQHPNIVEIHEYGELDGQPFYAMDLVDGRSLGELCAARPFPVVRAARLACEIARAVHYAHQQGILHRDLKPSNVLVDQDGRPRITDFGLARRLDDAGGVTQTGEMLGSPGYAAPEQAAGRIQEIGACTDVYGLGALFYHLLTGRAPFNASTPTETLRLVLDCDPVGPRMLNPAVPRDLETICLRCLAKEPARRYATAAEVAEDLERFLENRPIRARPPSVVYRARKFVRRYRVGVAAVAAVIVALAVGLTLALLGYRRAAEQHQAANTARARSQEIVNFIMLKSLPQMQTLGRRKAVLESARTVVGYFEQLPVGLQNPGTMRAHAKALDLLVQAHGRSQFRWTSTDPEESRLAAARAATLWRQVAASEPTDADAIGSAIIDEYLASRGGLKRSGIQIDAVVGKLLVECRDLELRFSNNEIVQKAMINLLAYQAIEPGTRGDTAEAASCGHECRVRSERLLARRPDDTALRQNLAGAWGVEAQAQFDNNDWEGGMRSLEEGLAIANAVLADDPTNLESLGLATMMAMKVMWAERVESRSLDRVGTARAYTKALIALDPEDLEWRFLDAMALSMEAVAYSNDRRFGEALRSVRQALEIWETIPEGSYDRLLLVGTLGLAGTIAADAGDTSMAVNMSDRLKRALRKWAEDGNGPYWRSLRRFNCLFQLGQIADAMRDPAKVQRLAQEMLTEAESRTANAAGDLVLPSGYRAGAQAMLGRALLEQGSTAGVAAMLDEAVRRFQANESLAPFYEFPLHRRWQAAEDLSSALLRSGDRKRAVDLLEWSFAKRSAHVRMGGLLESRVQLAQCACQLAQALDPGDPSQASRRHEVLTRAAEILDDPKIVSRLTPKDLELRTKIANALLDSSHHAQETMPLAETGT